MTRALLLIALALAPTAGGGCSSKEGVGSDRVKIVLAQGAPAQGFVQAAAPETGQTVYLSTDAILTGRDIKSAELLKTSDGQPAVGVAFTPAGKEKLAHFTTEHSGQWLAIVVDGRVSNVSAIRMPITDGHMLIAGKMTHERAIALAEALVAPPGK
jgi:preprotein translocase subunit SecD